MLKTLYFFIISDRLKTKLVSETYLTIILTLIVKYISSFDL